MTSADARRGKQTSNPDPWDLDAQGWILADKAASLDSFAAARRLFERALELDSADVWALVGVAFVDLNVALSFYPDDRAALLAAAEATLVRALSLDPENATAHLALGIIQIRTYRAHQGILECERALELNRTMLSAHGHIGFGKLQLGRAEETEAHIQEALRLNPCDRFAYLWYLFAGLAKLYLGRDEEAVARLRRSIEADRHNPMSHFLLASALAHLGRLTEAQSEVKAGLAINPTFTISRMCAGSSTDNPSANAGRERLIVGLRKAGVPEV